MADAGSTNRDTPDTFGLKQFTSQCDELKVRRPKIGPHLSHCFDDIDRQEKQPLVVNKPNSSMEGMAPLHSCG